MPVAHHRRPTGGPHVQRLAQAGARCSSITAARLREAWRGAVCSGCGSRTIFGSVVVSRQCGTAIQLGQAGRVGFAGQAGRRTLRSRTDSPFDPSDLSTEPIQIVGHAAGQSRCRCAQLEPVPGEAATASRGRRALRTAPTRPCFPVRRSLTRSSIATSSRYAASRPPSPGKCLPRRRGTFARRRAKAPFLAGSTPAPTSGRRALGPRNARGRALIRPTSSSRLASVS